MPFAIFLYKPEEEWEMRKAVEGLIIRLSIQGKNVTKISFESLMWDLFKEIETKDPDAGLSALIEDESLMGFKHTQETIQRYLSGEIFGEDGISIIHMIERTAQNLNPKIDIIFLIHAAALAPDFFQISSLLERMQGKIMIPTIAFYPGTKEGAIGLRFMDLRDREPTGNYRVNIY